MCLLECDIKQFFPLDKCHSYDNLKLNMLKEKDSRRFNTKENKSRSEPGNAPRIGIGHREVVCQKQL